jgi:uncharacterized protein YndB with AHSA1/START domain
MAILKKVLLGLVALIVLLVIVSFFLPGKFNVERSLVIAAPAEKIYPMISEPRNWPKWGVWNKRDPNMVITYSGSEGGQGAKWAWKSKPEGDGAMEFTAATPNREVSYVLSFADFDMKPTGTLKLSAEGSGTKVTWTSAGELGNNPINRYFGLAMDGMLGKDFEGGLANLKALVEKG